MADLNTKSTESNIFSISGFTLPFILIFGAGLRIFHLGKYSLWCDEVDTLYAGIHSVNYHPPFFLKMAAFWAQYFGKTDFQLRLLPALIGVAGIYFIYILTKRILNKQTALIAAILIAVSPAAIYYSREFRMYVFFLSMAAFSWDRFIEWMEKGGFFRFVVIALVDAILVYTHHFAFLFLLGQFSAGLFHKPYKKSFYKISSLFTAVIVLYLPWLVKMYYLIVHFTGSKFWANPVTWKTPYYTLRFLCSHFEPSQLHTIVLIVLCAAFALLGIISSSSIQLRRYFVFGFILSIIAIYSLALLLPANVYVARYGIFILNPFIVAQES